MKPLRMSRLTLVLIASLVGVFDRVSAEQETSTNAVDPPTKSTDSSSVDGKVAGSNEVLDAGASVLEGRVTFEGKLPPLREIAATKDVKYCSQHVESLPEVVVSDSRGLSGAVIEIRGIKEPEAGWSWKHPKEGYAVRQKGCAFEPYLLIMPDQQELTIHNDDPVAHNINTGQFNLLQAAGAEPLKQNIRGRRPVRVSCNIHSWMESWIYLAQSPYYAVTGENGEYRIEDIPPGRYRVTVWHPNLRALRESVQLSPGKSIEQEFVFTSPYKG